MKEAKLCRHCGAKMVEYPHTLSRSLARVIFRICQNIRAGDPGFHVGSCGLTNSQINNLQKLRYWGLIAKARDASAKGGHWKSDGRVPATASRPSGTALRPSAVKV